MLSTGASAGAFLPGAPAAAETNITNTTVATTDINPNLRTLAPPIRDAFRSTYRTARLDQRHPETVVGRSLERGHAVALCGLGELAGDVRRHGRWRRGDGHPALATGVAVLERTPDGERYAGVLVVDEERLAVGGEGGAGELGVVEPVAGEPVDLPVWGYTHDPVHGVPIHRLVLGEPQVAPRRDDDVVGALHLARLCALVEELERLGRRQVPEDLAKPLLAAY